ncbi:MAG: ABC transporter permease subunit [Candidatus Baltobacteraceae bacterium]|jgi:NitT/TauT family transport system permease protein
MTRSAAQGALAGALGLALTFGAWEALGRLHVLGTFFPPFSAVVAYLLAPEHRPLLLAAATQTAGEAFAGYLIGSAAGLGLAVLSLLFPPSAPGLERLAAIVNGIPVIAVGSVCAVIFPPDANPVIVAALAVFFMMFVASNAGLAAASGAHRELFAVLGASPATTFWRLRLPAAVPALVDGLRLSAPVAVVGAIIGEWFASERGLGPLLLNAMQNYQIPLLWSAAVLGALVSGVAYAALSIAQRLAAERYRA